MGPVPVAIEFLPLSREYDTPATRAWLNRELPTVSSGMFEDLQRIPTAGLTLRDYVISAPDAPWIDSTTLMSRRDVSTVRFGLRLSPLAYSADSSEAVVYAVVACGAVCGSADYFVLQRAGPLSWRVRKVVRRWTG